VTSGYTRYWSLFWFALACPVLITAFIAWSWVGVISMTMVAMVFTCVIFGSTPGVSNDPRTVYGDVPWQRIISPGLRWAVVAVAVILTTVLSPWLGVLVLLAVVGSSPWSLRRVRGRDTRPTDDLSPERIRELVRQLDVAGLCWAWRSSHDLLARIQDVEARGKVVMLRQAYLDEMERRDAAGFQAWLTVARAAEDPEAYLHEDGGAAAA
jgi:hypothetical protein